MSIRVNSVNGLGALGSLSGLSPSQVKSTLNILEAATGETGRYNAGLASNNSFGGAAGFHVFRATYHLVIDATACGGELTALAASLAGLLSSTVGDALSEADDVTRSIVGVIGSSLSLLDKSAFGKSAAEVLWLADQLSGKKFLEKFLDIAASEIGRLAQIYLTIRETGVCGGTTSAGSPAESFTPSPTLTAGQTFRQRFGSSALVISQGEQTIDPGPDTTPIDPNRAPIGGGKGLSPVVLIGSAAAIAALLLVK